MLRLGVSGMVDASDGALAGQVSSSATISFLMVSFSCCICSRAMAALVDAEAVVCSSSVMRLDTSS